MKNFSEVIFVSSRKNELRYITGVIPELHAIGVKVTVLLFQFKLHRAKSHLVVDHEMASLLRKRFPLVSVELVVLGNNFSPSHRAEKMNAVFMSVDPPDTFASRLSLQLFPWIQIQHADDLFMTNGLSAKKADGFLLWGEKWISDEVRLDPTLSSLSRRSIDYVKSKPVAFPGHLGLNASGLREDETKCGELDPKGTVLLFDHAVGMRGRSPLGTLMKTLSICSRHPLEIRDLRVTFKKLGRNLRKEGMGIEIRPRPKGLSLPLGYPRGAVRVAVDLGNDDPSQQVLASKGIISFFPSSAILEALFLGKPVLGIDWWNLIDPKEWIHSSLQRVLWSELQQSSCPAFRIVGPDSSDFSLRDFFAESAMLGTFDMDGWISPSTSRREELARLMSEVSRQR